MHYFCKNLSLVCSCTCVHHYKVVNSMKFYDKYNVKKLPILSMVSVIDSNKNLHFYPADFRKQFPKNSCLKIKESNEVTEYSILYSVSIQ